MPISDRDRKLLWGRAGSRCAICRLDLTRDSHDPGARAIVGGECHIVARSPAGPRGRKAPPDDSYPNLILLCGSDHTMVDQLPSDYPPDRLRDLKADHEAWVRSTLSKLGNTRTRRSEVHDLPRTPR